jgi:hypothetical protein
LRALERLKFPFQLVLLNIFERDACMREQKTKKQTKFKIFISVVTIRSALRQRKPFVVKVYPALTTLDEEQMNLRIGLQPLFSISTVFDTSHLCVEIVPLKSSLFVLFSFFVRCSSVQSQVMYNTLPPSSYLMKTTSRNLTEQIH